MLCLKTRCARTEFHLDIVLWGIVGCILFFKCLILGCNCAILNSKALESLYFLKLLYGYDLAEGEELYVIVGSTASITGSELEKLDKPITVYNLEVADFNTYFVGDEAVLVHNYNEYDIDDYGKFNNQKKDLLKHFNELI